MASLPHQAPLSRAQLIERRWERIRQGRIRSTDDKPAPRPPRIPRLPPDPQRLRRWVTRGATMLALTLVANLGWSWWRTPSATDLQAGENLFTHKWEANDPLSAAGDGLGPVYNARSCAECHFQGGIGGGGGLKQNVAAFEVLPTVGHPLPTGGVIHAASVDPTQLESFATVREVFPIVNKGLTITAVCQTPLLKDYDPVRQNSINTPTLFGAGAIDRISPASIRANYAKREVANIQNEFELDFTRPSGGRVHVLPDGRIGKFGWKAQFATLEEFVANACAVEVGLSTPTAKQHKPMQHQEDTAAKPDLDHRQFRQLVSFVANLPAPRLDLPTDPTVQAHVKRGQELFSKIGCADCHTPNLGGIEGIYSDLCLHDISPPEDTGGYTITPQVPVPDHYPRPGEWKTPPLWGVAQTAPYLHDGSAGTLTDAIQAHAGKAKSVREGFNKLPPDDRQAVLKFLESLVVKP